MDKQFIVIKDLCEAKQNLGKKQLQKLMYLIERHGLNLNLKFNMHFYGPYSAQLDYYIHEYESYGILNIDTTKSTHTISLNNMNKSDSENEAFWGELEECDSKIEDFVLAKYGNYTPADLEALTTIDFVAHFLYSDKESKSKVLEMVKKIKGAKFSDEVLDKLYNYINQTGLMII